MISKLIRLPRRQLHTIISRETIKPSSPTPSHLKTYNLSSLDQLAVHEYAPLILFYPKNANCRLSAHDKISEMKKSLSHSLTRYYPFAGRLHTPTSPYVDCNDEGVVFVEAQNDSQLKTLQHISEQDQSLDHLFADGLVWDSSPRSTNILGVQVSHFACGGMGVAVSMSHMIGDGCTLGSFMNHWASVARYGSTDHKELLPLNPHFIVSPSSNSVPPVAQIMKEKSQLEGIESVQQAAENLKSLQSKLGNENIEDVAERSYWCSSLYANRTTMQLPRSFSTTMLPNDCSRHQQPGDLIRANFTSTTHTTMADLERYMMHKQNQQLQTCASRKGVPRSCSVGMGRIDEDRVREVKGYV
ncbi:hypothetical protein L1887_11696 [Cichorium endivia]|nr:hypothetical protein L1887_11696 [Cichorium endivia]